MHKPMRKLSFLIMLCTSGNLFAEQQTYDMSVFGFTFGQMTVTRTRENDSTELYVLHAKGKTNFIGFVRDDETTIVARCRNGKLYSSSYVQVESGVTKHWSKISFDGQRYQVDSYLGKRTFTRAPAYCVLELYFDYKQQEKEIFHEAGADYIALKHLKNNSAEITAPDGSRSIFHFTNGKLEEVVVHISIATVHLKRVN